MNLFVALLSSVYLTSAAALTYQFNAKTGVLTITGNDSTVESKKVNRAIRRIYSSIENTKLKRVDFSGATGINSIDPSTFMNCSNLTTVTLPSTLTSIGNASFSGCRSLTTIELPASITSIKCYAFARSGLTIITLPASLSTIGREAFSQCRSLREITCLTATQPPMGYRAFDRGPKRGRTLYAPKAQELFVAPKWAIRFAMPLLIA